MAVDLTQAKTHLNIDDTTDDVELQFFVDAANEWVATQVDSSNVNATPVQLATLELLRHWWDTQRQAAADSGLDAPDENWHLGLLGFSIPTRVRELLGPYRIAVSAVGSFPPALCYPDPVQRWPVW